MKKDTISIYTTATLKNICFVIVFCYFGFIINPQWAPVPALCFPLFFLPSPQYFHWYDPFPLSYSIWLITLPIVLLVLAIIGSWGIIGLTSKKEKKIFPNPTYKSFIKFSSFGFLWFIFSLIVSMGTNFIYNNQKFDAEVWRNHQSTEYVPYQLTLRQRMVGDLTENILPGNTLDEIEALLGPSLEVTGFWSQGPWICGTLGSPDLAYYIGPDRGGGMAGESLLIWLDESGKFECARTGPDG